MSTVFGEWSNVWRMAVWTWDGSVVWSQKEGRVLLATLHFQLFVL